MNRKSKTLKTAGIGLIAVVVWTVLIMPLDVSPSETYAMFFKDMLRDLNGFMGAFVKATPLIFTGLGCVVTLRTDFFNAGAEGQFYVGALASAWAALTWTGIPGAFYILCVILIGFVSGGLWVLITTMLKAKLGILEIIVTTTLDYIAINLLGVVARAFLMDPVGSIPRSPKLDPSVTLYRFLKPTGFHTGLIIVVFMVFPVWFILEEATMGYEIRAVGFNKRAVVYNGISVVGSITTSAFLGGGLAGIVGAVEVMGVQRKSLEGIPGECEYTAVFTALLVSNHLLGVPFAAIAFVALEVGTNFMQRQMGMSSAIVSILVGLIVPLALGRELFHRKRKEEKPYQSKS